jgi:hypothetical protein
MLSDKLSKLGPRGDDAARGPWPRAAKEAGNSKGSDGSGEGS